MCDSCPPLKGKRIRGARTCQRCGTWFWITTTYTDRDKKYCSTSCVHPWSCPGQQLKSPTECAWCGHRFFTKTNEAYCSDDCRSFMGWYRDKKRALSWRIEYLTCPNPECEGVKTVRPGSSERACCDDDCEAAFRQHQFEGGTANRHGRGWITPRRRYGIYRRDKWTCQICGDLVDRDLPPGTPLSASLDHILPRSDGGSNDNANLRLAHFICNSVRGATPDGAQLRLVG